MSNQDSNKFSSDKSEEEIVQASSNIKEDKHKNCRLIIGSLITIQILATFVFLWIIYYRTTENIHRERISKEMAVQEANDYFNQMAPGYWPRNRTFCSPDKESRAWICWSLVGSSMVALSCDENDCVPTFMK